MEKLKGLTTVRNGIGLLIIAFALLHLYGCSSVAGEKGTAAPPPMELPVIAINKITATTYLEYAASLEGSKVIEIRPQVDGYLEKIYIDEGAYVKKGQRLFQINDRIYREHLNNAKAALAVAQANLANADVNLAKIRPLVENNVVSDVQLKTAQAAYDAAFASVSQAQAQVQNAEINLGYTIMTAPVDGYIGRLPLKIGSLVGMSTAEALTVISEIKEVFAYFSLSENDFLMFKNLIKGNSIEEKISNIPPVELLLPDGSIYDHKGKVQTVSGQFDNSVGAISFRAVFPNEERLLRSGNTGKIRIPNLLSDALVVPQEATFEIQDKVFVFALGDSNKVLSKPIIITGKTAAYYFAKEGIEAGERIVFSGSGNLNDGMIIMPRLLSMDSLLKVRPL